MNGQAGRDRVIGVPVGRIRERPTTTSDIVGRKRAGDPFRACQRIQGQRVAGDRIWLGDRTGERRMHASLFRAIKQEGADPGSTRSGEDAEAAALPDAAGDQGTDDEVLEGIEDGVDEEVVDEVAAESRPAYGDHQIGYQATIDGRTFSADINERGGPWPTSEATPGSTTPARPPRAAGRSSSPRPRTTAGSGEVVGREAFRWHHGPMFFRGRLDGSARVVMVGQEGAQDESLSHRSFTGGTGARMQHFLRFLGLDRSYLFLNSFVYPIFGQYTQDLRKLAQDPRSPIVKHRNRILDKAVVDGDVRLVVAVGRAAKESVATWIESHGGTAQPESLHTATLGSTCRTASASSASCIRAAPSAGSTAPSRPTSSAPSAASRTGSRPIRPGCPSTPA